MCSHIPARCTRPPFLTLRALFFARENFGRLSFPIQRSGAPPRPASAARARRWSSPAGTRRSSSTAAGAGGAAMRGCKLKRSRVAKAAPPVGLRRGSSTAAGAGGAAMRGGKGGTRGRGSSLPQGRARRGGGWGHAWPEQLPRGAVAPRMNLNVVQEATRAVLAIVQKKKAVLEVVYRPQLSKISHRCCSGQGYH